MLFKNKKTGGVYTLTLFDKYGKKVTLVAHVWIKAIHMTVDEFMTDYEFLGYAENN
jgi:hypothetical protein